MYNITGQEYYVWLSYIYLFIVILILQQRTKEQEMTGSSLRDKITALSNQVDTQNKIISELQKDKERLADDLEETRKKESSKCEELLSLKQNIKQRDEQLASMRSSLATTEKEHASEVALLQTRLKEQSSMLKEYQDKVGTFLCWIFTIMLVKVN